MKTISKVSDWYFDQVIDHPIRTAFVTLSLAVVFFFLSAFAGSEILALIVAMPMGFFLVLSIMALVDWANHRHDD